LFRRWFQVLTASGGWLRRLTASAIKTMQCGIAQVADADDLEEQRSGQP
jgi:hypothetical protein